MTERQLVPEVFRAAFEDSDVLDNFNNWSDDHIKRLVSDFLRHDQYDGDLEEQGPEPFNVLYRFREIAKESHRQGIFPEVVEYSDIFIKIKPYGKFANLKNAFYIHRRNPQEYLLDLKKNILSLIKLFVRSKALYNFDSSMKGFFSPVLKSV